MPDLTRRVSAFRKSDWLRAMHTCAFNIYREAIGAGGSPISFTRGDQRVARLCASNRNCRYLFRFSEALGAVSRALNPLEE